MSHAAMVDAIGASARAARGFAGWPMAVTAAALGVLLGGCGAGSAQTQANPQATTPRPTAQSYAGPAPASADVQAFVVNLWNNVQGQDRCGACHVQASQSPMFARSDDVNLAYAAAQTVVSLSQPASSAMVTKVGGGHHCWLSSNAACADSLTTWIKNWAGVTLGASASQVQLAAPALMDAGSSRSFPSTSALFGTTVYPLLRQYCSRCHAPDALTPQAPYFAQTDVDAAYAAAQPKINLDQPTLSRFYVRLKFEFHNCWGGNCDASAASMLQAIQSFAGQVPLTQVAPNLVLSKALTMYDGIVYNGGTRAETGLIAKYEFKTGAGTTAYDTSGVQPELDLELNGNVTWVGGWGVQLAGNGKLQGTTSGSAKLHDMVLSTGEYSVEAWIAPDNVAQSNAYIVSYSGGETARNFTLGQMMYNYDFYQRSTTTDANGQPAFSTPTAGQFAQATLQHVVLTSDPVNGRRLYVNGTLAASGDKQLGGSLTQWDNTFALVLGNEVSGTRPWSGVIKMVALYNHAMQPAEVMTNFNAGVGERYLLLFNVDKYTALSQTYVMFEVLQYDSYSYLFTKPMFLSLDPATTYNGLVIKGMRIAENGAELTVGQAYAPLSTSVSGSGFDPTKGTGKLVPLSAIGTVVELQKGPAYDQFFLTFEQLGGASNAHVEPTPVAPTPVDIPLAADIGVRNFNQINATLSVMTTVPTTQPAVAALYVELQQDLPAGNNFLSFVSSNQTAIAQLAIQYCDALVSDAPLAAAYFPGFNFGAPPASAFSGAGFNAMLTPLVDHMLSANTAAGKFLATQPSATSVGMEIGNLVTKLQATAPASGAGTATIVKAACAAIAGSSVMLVE